MKVYDRQSKTYIEIRQYGQEKLQFLYENPLGRMVLKLVISPVTSRIYGWYNRQPRSAEKISGFIKEHGICMEDFEEREYRSFSDFFTRKLRSGARRIDRDEVALISPADAKLLVYEISDGLKIPVKGSDYTVEELLGIGGRGGRAGNGTGNSAVNGAGNGAGKGAGNGKGNGLEISCRINLADFQGGRCLVFRLCMDDYHRYCFMDQGRLTGRYSIKGKLHTVSSISKDYKIYKENSRVVNVYQTGHFDRVIQIEVGALLVGRIRNRKVRLFEKGEEKGFFEPGGSTIIVLLQKGVVDIDEDIMRMSAQGIETIVHYGEKIGVQSSRRMEAEEAGKKEIGKRETGKKETGKREAGKRDRKERDRKERDGKERDRIIRDNRRGRKEFTRKARRKERNQSKRKNSEEEKM